MRRGLWARLVPTYGNWGGPGWSGGTRSGPAWGVEAVDDLDAAFKAHDKAYYYASSHAERSDADFLLSYRIANLLKEPAEWGTPPKSPYYAMLYGRASCVVFVVLSILRRVAGG